MQPKSTRTYLYCPKCESEYSTCPSDYFLATRSHVFKCCRVNCWLVEKGDRWSGDEVLQHPVTVGDLHDLAAVV